MNPTTILQISRLPARLTSEQTAELLGFMAHDIPVLIRSKLLRPLATPAPNAPKYFAACEVTACASDPQWLNRATKACSDRWRRKNERRSVS